MRLKIQTIILAGLVVFSAGCTDNRPDEQQAQEIFSRLYPEATVVNVRNTEDEVVACSYEFSYRKGATGIVKKISIQFMEADDGIWKPRPPAPKTLP